MSHDRDWNKDWDEDGPTQRQLDAGEVPRGLQPPFWSSKKPWAPDKNSSGYDRVPTPTELAAFHLRKAEQKTQKLREDVITALDTRYQSGLPDTIVQLKDYPHISKQIIRKELEDSGWTVKESSDQREPGSWWVIRPATFGDIHEG